jgi:hypothetical protein
MYSQIASPYITDARESVLDPFYPPKLLAGETTQGFMTATYIPPPKSFKIEPLREEPLEPELLRQLMCSLFSHPKIFVLLLITLHSIAPGHLRLCEQLGESAVQVLVDSGLQSRFPTDCSAWNEGKANDALLRQDEAHMKEVVSLIDDALFEAIVDKYCDFLPCVICTLNISCYYGLTCPSGLSDSPLCFMQHMEETQDNFHVGEAKSCPVFCLCLI